MPDFGIPTVFTGRLDTEQQMATAYAAADATVLASKYDNLPNILVESLACGIPAAAFATGGIPEIMEDRVSGALAEPFQPESLADALAWILEHPHPEQLAAAARHRAESCFDIRDCAGRYSGCTPDCGNVFHRLPDTPSARRSDPGNHGKSTIFSQWDLTNATLFGIILL